MTFSDDDLKRLKEDLIKVENGIPVITVTVGVRMMEAILARLETAENALHFHGCSEDLEEKEYYKIWRKEAGK